MSFLSDDSTLSSPSTSSPPHTPPNLHQNTMDPSAKWLVQKYGGTSVGKFATKIAEDIVPYVHLQSKLRPRFWLTMPFGGRDIYVYVAKTTGNTWINIVSLLFALHDRDLPRHLGPLTSCCVRHLRRCSGTVLGLLLPKPQARSPLLQRQQLISGDALRRRMRLLLAHRQALQSQAHERAVVPPLGPPPLPRTSLHRSILL